ncbi:DNA-binding transcriptional MerR regulator [Paenibacillus anaericanus]|uniref:MerR family transcriptional regulator n=1 Tax=Paenibacillus anaericanus TaxID=170367 RepID=UPI00278035FB|nr:MerR family transcriptional regulator [Paenibacillus anaericanus]MDQ0090751.1 DNA-binding transcriptional MerR regulator [Paenibacillus anaericanus]
MLISEISKRCELTKKAISYYEKQGLLEVKYNHSGYRDFDEYDVTLLKEINIFRKLGMSVSEIKKIIKSDDKHKTLSDFRLKKEIHMQHAIAQYECLNYLVESNSTIEDAFYEIAHKLDDNIVIKDKLLQAFPGNYGMYLYVHFGKFLDGKLDSDEKIIAYNRIVEFLDHVDSLEFPKELQQYMTDVFDSLSQIKLEEMDQAVVRAINDYDHYMEENKETITKYLEYRNSEEFKSSPAYRMQQILIDFQKKNGYYDIFIPNIKILSNSYQKYQDKLELMNERFLTEYPEAKLLDNYSFF